MKLIVTGKILLPGCGCLASLAHAQTPAAATSAVGGQMMSLVISTAAVIALIAGAAWLLKRMAPRHYSSTGTLRVVAGAAVGPRERVVVVEIGMTWLVLGVAPGNVNVLHQLPRAEAPAAAVAATHTPAAFAQWLARVTGKPQ